MLPLIACGGLLAVAGCQKSDNALPAGDHTPVNESAMPPPEVSATDTGTTEGATPAPAQTPVPSPTEATGAASPGA